MKRAVLVSIQPCWCEKILRGEKTVEVRKTRPKLQPPFKCYIYCTMDHPYISVSCGELDKLNYRTNTVGRCNGKVIGEFVCDGTVWLTRVGFTRRGGEPEYRIENNGDWKSPIDRLLEEACLTEEEIDAYLGGNPGFGWHISDLKIYSRPVDITNFHSCLGCEYVGDCDTYCWDPVQIPPQSWRYVEENEGVLG